MIPLPALQARPLELDTRCGIHGGNSGLVTGLEQRARASGESDIMSLSAARHKCLSSGRTTQARNSPAKPGVTPLGHLTSANINSSIFGDVTSANDRRIEQMALKLFF
jgi:hypothetical protein